ncbi:MAG TPA: isochorismatase family protein [Acidimicrobiales bacterium]|nr:isochorismatase family protein [Acidimicrobiales bacterium]
MADDTRCGGTYGPKGERGSSFAAGKIALVVIDPVNDFLSDWDMARSTVEKYDVLGHLKQAIEAARERGIDVLFAPMAFTAEDYENEESWAPGRGHRLHQRDGVACGADRRGVIGSWCCSDGTGEIALGELLDDRQLIGVNLAS